MKLTWIAEQPVIFVYPSGRRVAGRIAVGLPVRVDAAEAQCAIWIEGCDRSPLTITGSDTLQALMLAVRFAGMRLHDFLRKGGRVVSPEEGWDVPLDAVFGALLQQPSIQGRPGARRRPGARTRRPRRTARRTT